jgi:hypothetical protein
LVVTTGQLVDAVPEAVEHGWSARFGWLLVCVVALFFTQQCMPMACWAVSVHLRNLVETDTHLHLARAMLGGTGLAHLDDPKVHDLHRRASGVVGFEVQTGVNGATHVLLARTRAVLAARWRRCWRPSGSSCG